VYLNELNLEISKGRIGTILVFEFIIEFVIGAVYCASSYVGLTWDDYKFNEGGQKEPFIKKADK